MRKRKGIANKKYAREIHELRRSNASGVHKDKRTKRVRTRGSSKKAAIRYSADGRFRYVKPGCKLLGRWPVFCLQPYF